MSGLRILLIIGVSLFVGDLVVMILDNTPMNIWVIRLFGGIACAISGMSLTKYYQKKKD